jgi:protein TonB
MTALRLAAAERRQWGLAGGVALAAHIVIGALALSWVRPAETPLPEPVVLVELPPEAAPAPTIPVAQPAAQPQHAAPEPQAQAQPATPPIAIPPVRAPLPVNPVTLPAPAPVRQTVASPAPAPAAATPAATIPARSSSPAPSTVPGTNPRARQQEADYFSLVSAHLNRRKTYPVEARQARQQGVVTVRFTVDRNGGVSGTSIKRSSGHDVLDQATLALLQRVAPLPRMPATMQRDSVTLSLPIDYTLRTN